MSIIFSDSWDHYSVIANKWDLAGTDCSIDLTGTKSRTGIGCMLVLSSSAGPTKTITATTTPLVGTAWYSNIAGEVMRFMYLASGAQNVRIQVLGDGSIQALVGNDGGVAVTVLGTSAISVVHFNQYNYIEVKCNIAAAPNGSVVIKVNGVQVLSVTGVKTYAAPIDSGQPFVTGIQLMGPGGLPDCRHDDTYIVDWGISPLTDFLGAIAVYAQAPTADGTPLNWTPSTGTDHYAMVDEIPPNGDTDYVSSAVVGDVDQYSYGSTGVPVGSTLLAVQHVLDAKIDAAGSRSIGSVVSGVASAGQALTTTYHMVTVPYGLNPATGVAWALADFPVQAGPKVTA
jgi:hypothetical protein